jgi:hypothetical protein
MKRIGRGVVLWSLGASAALAVVSPAWAQQAFNPDYPVGWPRPCSEHTLPKDGVIVEVGPPNDPRPLPPRPPLPEIKDQGVASAVALLKGSFRAPPAGDQVGLDLHLARIDVTGTDAAVYFEMSRSDAPEAPFRQGVLVVERGEGGLRLRVMDFRGEPGFPRSVVGLWMAPDRFPRIGMEFLAPRMDMAITSEGAGWSAKTGGKIAVTGGPAEKVEAGLSVREGELSIREEGFAAGGARVFGSGDAPRVFKAFTPACKSQILEGGVLVLDMVPPGESSLTAADGMFMASTYTGWLVDGTQFAHWETDLKRPVQFAIPAPFINGWKKGIKGMTVGTVRRLQIPPGQAFSHSGDRRWNIPPGAMLTFETRCVWLVTAEEMAKVEEELVKKSAAAANAVPPPPPPPPTPASTPAPSPK